MIRHSKAELVIIADVIVGRRIVGGDARDIANRRRTSSAGRANRKQADSVDAPRPVHPQELAAQGVLFRCLALQIRILPQVSADRPGLSGNNFELSFQGSKIVAPVPAMSRVLRVTR